MNIADEIKDFASNNGPKALAYLTLAVRNAIAKWHQDRDAAIASIASDREQLAAFDKLVDEALAQLPHEDAKP